MRHLRPYSQGGPSCGGGDAVNRRRFLALGAGSLTVAIGGCADLPTLPSRPPADARAALGWIAHENGRYTLACPRAEMGQDVASALKRIACVELGVAWDDVHVRAQATDAMTPVRGTVGSESIRDFALPLANACATLREALAAGLATGTLRAVERPPGNLRAFAAGALDALAGARDGATDIVDGRPIFAGDVWPDGLCYGRIERPDAPPDARAVLAGFDAAAAARVPGFIAAFPDPDGEAGPGPGLGFVAETPGALMRAVEAAAIVWRVDEAPPAADADPLDAERRLRTPVPSRIVAATEAPAPAWDVDVRVDMPYAAHAQIEPRTATARFEAGRLRVWTGSQDVFYVRAVLARRLRMTSGAVAVENRRMGGAFGGRTTCTVELEAAWLALKASRPVKVQWRREDEFVRAFHRPPSAHRVRAALRNGRLVGWRHDFATGHVILTAAVLPPALQRVATAVAGDLGVERGAIPPYAVGPMAIGYDAIRLPVPTGPWRGLGAGPNALAIETAIDAAAAAAGIDPVAFRLAHATDPRLRAVLERVARASGWGEAAANAPSGTRIGRGVACGVYKQNAYAAVVAEVAAAEGGAIRVRRMWCAHDCGFVADPDRTAAQVEGNLIWSVGMVLSEKLETAAGVPATRGLRAAGVPAFADAPELHVELVRSAEAPGGAGETAIVAGPGAIANAIAAATGRRPRAFPYAPQPALRG